MLYEFTSHDTCVSLLPERFEFVFRDEELRKDIEIVVRSNSHSREKVMLVYVYTPEPVCVDSLVNSRHHQYSGPVGQRKREDERNRVAGNQPIRRGGVNADIPGLHDRIEQAKSKDCHCHRENGEKGPQSLPECISYDEFKK